MGKVKRNKRKNKKEKKASENTEVERHYHPNTYIHYPTQSHKT